MRTFLLIVLVAQMLFFAGSAQAMNQDTRAIVRGGTYGLIGGTVVGLAVLPLTGSVRGVFIGSSLGLYAGILMGVYQITHRDDPGNPLRGELPDAETHSAPIGQMTPMDRPLATRVSFSLPILHF